MRRVRWKKGYATGNRHLDERNKALVGIIQEIDGALRAKEHCQDMEDLQATLTPVPPANTRLPRDVLLALLNANRAYPNRADRKAAKQAILSTKAAT